MPPDRFDDLNGVICFRQVQHSRLSLPMFNMFLNVSNEFRRPRTSYWWIAVPIIQHPGLIERRRGRESSDRGGCVDPGPAWCDAGRDFLALMVPAAIND